MSISRPLCWLFALFLIGALVFYTMHSGLPEFSYKALPHAAALSFANIVPFVPVIHDIATTSSVIAMSRTEKLAGVLQTLLGTPLLFLLGLALRNRFRMK
jgi:hypothetical protein